MDSLEKLNCALKLTEARKERAEKAMLSLFAEWKNLESHLNSSTHQLLHDCFTDIQSREARLNEVKQSVTSSNRELDEIRRSLEERMEDVERREREVKREEGRVEEKRREVKCVFERFGMEKREVEGIREVIEERFEVVRLKGKSIENLEVKLEVIRGNLVEREKEVAMMREVNEKRSKEVESMEEGLVLKEKEIETVKKITHDLCHEVNLQKEKSDLEKREVEERVKELKIREKELEDRLKQFELKEKRIKESVEALDLKKKEMEAKNVPSEERGRRIEIREKKLEKQLKEFELKEKYFKEWVGSTNVKEKEIDLKNALCEERCRELQLREKKLDDQMKEFESKEKLFRERAKAIDLKKKGVDSGKILYEQRCEKLNLMEKNHNALLTEFKLKEQQLEDRVHSFQKKEKEVDSIRLSCEERCRKFELEKKNEFELKEKHFKEWVKTVDLKEKEIDSVWILNEERCKKLDSMEKTLHELLTGLKFKEQNQVETIEAKEKEVDLIRISCEERCRKFELEKRKLEDQMKESEIKRRQLSNVDHSIVKPEPCIVDNSYADIRFSITMGGKNLLLYLINQKRDLDSMTEEVSRALRMSMNPGKLVLDAMQDFYLIIEDKEFEVDVVCKSSILLLEQLRRISTQIPPRLKKAAMEVAHEWENKMKSSGEVTVFLNLLASYGLGSSFDPEEFLNLFEVIHQHVKISNLCQLLGYPDKINLIEMMLKKQQHVKALKYICVFGLRDKFQPASLLKDLLKNAEETSNTLRENSDYPVDKKDEVIDNIVASLREALVCIFHYKLESEYPPECMDGFIKQLIQEKEDEKVRLSASNNSATKQEAEKNCKSLTVVPDPAEGCTTTLTSPFLCNRNALAFILSNMGAKSLQVFLSENSEDHELLGYDIFNFLKLLKDPAKLVLNTIKGFDTPLLERDKYYESPVFMKSCILLLEQFMKQSPEIEPHVKEDAKKLACNWRVKMRTPVQVLGFLHLISAYGLILSFEVSELERHFEFVSCIKHAPELCQVFRFSDKRPNQTTSSSICDLHPKNTPGLEIDQKENDENKLIHSANYAKLVLDAIQSCYFSNCGNVKSVVAKCFIILLEQLLKMSPQIQPHVKEKAAKFAMDWKTLLVGYNNRKPAEVYGLFHLLAVYKVAPAVDSEELLGFLDCVYLRRTAPELVRHTGLSHRISDFIERIIQKGDRIQAIRYIYEFHLVGKFPPVPILKDHISSKIVPGNVISRQLAALREVIRCITDHQLEVEYPPDNLLAQLEQLLEQAKVTGVACQSFTNFAIKPPAASGPEAQTQKFVNTPHAASGPEAQTHTFVDTPHAASGPEAQTHKKFERKRCADPVPKAQTQCHVSKHPRIETQWHVSKHPQIGPPAGTPLNVPFPAFGTMTNFANSQGAYMQHVPEAHMRCHISQRQQIELAGPSLNVPSPALHSVTYFPKHPFFVNPQNALHGQHPQIEITGPSLNVPSPALHSVTNFPEHPLAVNPQNALHGQRSQIEQAWPSLNVPPPALHSVTNFPRHPLAGNPHNALHGQHPQIEQAGPSLNVPPPALHSVTNIPRHPLAGNLQNAPHGQHPQIEQAGPFLNVPSPALHSVTNFPQHPLAVNPHNALHGQRPQIEQARPSLNVPSPALHSATNFPKLPLVVNPQNAQHG